MAVLPALLALPRAAAGATLAGSALGLGLPLVEVVITAQWARALFLATGAFLLFDGGRMLALAHLVRGGALPVLVDADAPDHLSVLRKDL